MVDVGHDFVARQGREVREKSRVDKRGKGGALQKEESKFRQCIYWQMGAHWGVVQRSFSVEWHNIRNQASAQGPVGIRCPGPG